MASSLETIKNNPNELNWERESGYKGESFENEYPLRVDQPGSDAGLEITLVVHEKDRSTMCTSNDEEFEVFLSMPDESMDTIYMDISTINVPILTNSIIAMEPELTTTSEELRGYSPNERGCFHNSDRRLNFHKFYSEKNCQLECAANYSIQEHGCVPFFSPRTCVH